MKTLPTYSLLLLAATLFQTNVHSQNKTETRKIIKDSVIVSDNGKNKKEASEKSSTEKVVIKKTITTSETKDGNTQVYHYEVDEKSSPNKEEIKGQKKTIEVEMDSDRENKENQNSNEAAKDENLNINIQVQGTKLNLDIEAAADKEFYVSILDEKGKQFLYETVKDGGKYEKSLVLEKGEYSISVTQNKKTTTDNITIK